MSIPPIQLLCARLDIIVLYIDAPSFMSRHFLVIVSKLSKIVFIIVYIEIQCTFISCQDIDIGFTFLFHVLDYILILSCHV